MSEIPVLSEKPEDRKIIVRYVENKLISRAVILLGGYVKSGKTHVLKELEKRFRHGNLNVEYHDIRTMTGEDSEELLLRIKNSFPANEKTLYLIDNITYSSDSELAVSAICAEEYEERSVDTRVVFAGDRHILSGWASYKLPFDKDGFIALDYIKYDIWRDVYVREFSPDEHSDYLYNIDEYYGLTDYEKYLDSIDLFHGITDIRKHLEACLTEAEMSEKNAGTVIYNNDYTDLTVDKLLDAMYSVLLYSYNNAVNGTLHGIQLIERESEFELTALKMEKCIRRRIKAFWQKCHERFMNSSEKEFKKILIFLWRSGLVSLSNAEDVGGKNPVGDLLNDCVSCKMETNFKGSFYRDYIVRINHPLFFSALIKNMIADYGI